MLCKIADLLTEVPAAGGLAPRCKDYLWEAGGAPEIIIRQEAYRPEKKDPRMTEESFSYMEAAYQYYCQLVDFSGFYLHASAVVVDGRAYLFSGPCRAGKSTHTRLWQTLFGADALVINDDKPAIRYLDGRWYAYGTPWCGKDGINANCRAPLAGICFLKKAPHNKIRRLDPLAAMQKVLSQTIYKFETAEKLDKLLVLLNRFLEEIPVYELENLPEIPAARLSHDTMRAGAEEAGL